MRCEGEVIAPMSTSSKVMFEYHVRMSTSSNVMFEYHVGILCSKVMFECLPPESYVRMSTTWMATSSKVMFECLPPEGLPLRMCTMSSNMFECLPPEWWPVIHEVMGGEVCQKFSKVGSLLNWLCQMTIELTFENLLQLKGEGAGGDVSFAARLSR